MRRSTPHVLMVLIVSLLLCVLDVHAGAVVQNEDPAEIVQYEEKLIIPEVLGGTDEFGRAPLFRLTFQATAGIGPEDLPTPFTAYVESGTFTYRNAVGTWSELIPGSGITIGSGEDYALRNADMFSGATLLVLPLPGSCLRFADGACMPQFLPYDSLCDGPCRPDVSNTLLFSDQDLRSRLMTVRISVIAVALPPGESSESLDIGGESELIRLCVRVETGSVISFDGNTYSAGDEFTVQTGDTIQAGDSGARLIVLRLAASIESD